MNIKNKKKLMSRRYVLSFALLMIIGGVFLGISFSSILNTMKMSSFQNLSICILIYVVICLFFWLPLIVPSNQIVEITEDNVYILPKCNSRKKFKMVWYALLNNNIKPFYRSIPLPEIDKITFTFEAHWGSYAYQRFSYLLKFKIKEEKLDIYLNPGQNGPIFPSGNGMPFSGIMSNDEIVNLVEFFRVNQVEVADPYKLVDALKDPNIIMYDYMVSLKKKIIF